MIDRSEGTVTGNCVPSQQYAVKWHYGPRSEVGDTYLKLHMLMEEPGLRRNPLAWQLELQRNWSRFPEEEIELDLYCKLE